MIEIVASEITQAFIRLEMGPTMIAPSFFKWLGCRTDHQEERQAGNLPYQERTPAFLVGRGSF
jgi:hypothetical protein